MRNQYRDQKIPVSSDRQTLQIYKISRASAFKGEAQSIDCGIQTMVVESIKLIPVTSST